MSRDYRYLQIEEALLTAIREQRILTGERLPSVRTLCQHHSASKATVLHALHRLEAQGRVEARPKSGFYISAPLQSVSTPDGTHTISPPRPITPSELWLDIMHRSSAFDLLPKQPGNATPTGLIALHRSIGRALRQQRGNEHLYYDAPEGLTALREQLALNLTRRGCHLSADDLCITSGCQQALFLALLASTQPGDVVAVESPGFYGVLQLLEQLKLQVVEVPSSAEQGMSMTALAEVLERWPVKACVVSPAFSTPSGACMPLSARQQLLALAEQYDLAIIEDDIYADTAFQRVPDPLLALDQHQRVILCSSFSKSLSRDIRVGWIHGARWHGRIVQLKLVTQLASSRATQLGVANFLADGSYHTHLRKQRYEWRVQRNQLLQALQQWPVPVAASVPEGGLALWVQLPEHCNALNLYQMALPHGIVLTPGHLFSVSPQHHHYLRVGFTHPWDEARLKALHQLGKLLAQQVKTANG